MTSDLTERLAAKLGAAVYPSDLWAERPEKVPFDTLASVAHQILPLLLSEPELVASLPESVRLSVLTPRERAVMRVGAAVLRPSVVLSNARADLGDLVELTDALAEARALAPSPAPMEGTNDE